MSVECPRCADTNVTIKPVDERQQFKCEACQKRWYSLRGRSNRDYNILDKIANAVAVGSVHEVMAEPFYEVFSSDPQAMKTWLDAHGLEMHTFHKRNRNGRHALFLKFLWKK